VKCSGMSRDTSTLTRLFPTGALQASTQFLQTLIAGLAIRQHGDFIFLVRVGVPSTHGVLVILKFLNADDDSLVLEERLVVRVHAAYQGTQLPAIWALVDSHLNHGCFNLCCANRLALASLALAFRVTRFSSS